MQKPENACLLEALIWEQDSVVYVLANITVQTLRGEVSMLTDSMVLYRRQAVRPGLRAGRTAPCFCRCLRMSSMESSSERKVSSSLLLSWARRRHRSTSDCRSSVDIWNVSAITCKDRSHPDLQLITAYIKESWNNVSVSSLNFYCQLLLFILLLALEMTGTKQQYGLGALSLRCVAYPGSLERQQRNKSASTR